jgi:DNA replication and repair protein RecF
VKLLTLRCQNFRSLANGGLRFERGMNLVIGGNGQGKTSVLEAIAVLGTTRSFRTRNARALVRHGTRSFRLHAEIEASQSTFEVSQTVDVGPPLQRTLEIDGLRAEAEGYLRALPVVALSPSDTSLVFGPPEERRAFLDRFAFLLEPLHLRCVRDYRHTLRQRNAGLRSGVADRHIEVWEQHLARAAAHVIIRRRRALGRLVPAFLDLVSYLGGEARTNVAIDYRCEASAAGPDEGLEQRLEEGYHRARSRDRTVGCTVEGPHRHDLAIRVNERDARDVLSAGQTKVVAAALRLSTLQEVELDRGEDVPVIVDDVDSELDHMVFDRFLACLGVRRQLFLSTANGHRLGGKQARYLLMERGMWEEVAPEARHE